MTTDTVILFFADIFGRVGRKAVSRALPALKAEYKPDFIIGNAENISGGRGINRKAFIEMVGLGFHGFTGGNHTWDNKEVLDLMERDNRVLRPANYPSFPMENCPGKGHTCFHSGNKELWVINLLGRVFMD